MRNYGKTHGFGHVKAKLMTDERCCRGRFDGPNSWATTVLFIYTASLQHCSSKLLSNYSFKALQGDETLIPGQALRDRASHLAAIDVTDLFKNHRTNFGWQVVPVWRLSFRSRLWHSSEEK